MTGRVRARAQVLGDLARIVRGAEMITARGYDVFLADETQRLAGQQLIAQLGEAVAHLDDSFKASFPLVDWRRIRGMRNHVAHRYWAVDDDLVWEALDKHIPALGRSLGLGAPGDASGLPACGHAVRSTRRPCLLERGHRGRCRSVT